MNKLILFDWGNIVEAHQTHYSCYDAFRDVFKECGYTGEVEAFDYIGKYKTTRIQTEEEFKQTYRLMQDDMHLNKTYEEFKKLYKEIFDKIDYYKDVRDYEHSLKNRCKIGILSNLLIFDKERLDRQVDLSKYDYVFLSFELGMRKPDEDIYKYVLEHVDVEAKDILFIDDKKSNVEAAIKCGMNAFQVTGLELDKIKEKCEEFLNN